MKHLTTMLLAILLLAACDPLRRFGKDQEQKLAHMKAHGGIIPHWSVFNHTPEWAK